MSAQTKTVVFSQKSAELCIASLLARSKELLKLAKKAQDLGQIVAVTSIKREALEVNTIVAVLSKEFDIDTPEDNDEG